MPRYTIIASCRRGIRIADATFLTRITREIIAFFTVPDVPHSDPILGRENRIRTGILLEVAKLRSDLPVVLDGSIQ